MKAMQKDIKFLIFLILSLRPLEYTSGDVGNHIIYVSIKKVINILVLKSLTI